MPFRGQLECSRYMYLGDPSAQHWTADHRLIVERRGLSFIKGLRRMHLLRDPRHIFIGPVHRSRESLLFAITIHHDIQRSRLMPLPPISRSENRISKFLAARAVELLSARPIISIVMDQFKGTRSVNAHYPPLRTAPTLPSQVSASTRLFSFSYRGRAITLAVYDALMQTLITLFAFRAVWSKYYISVHALCVGYTVNHNAE